VDPKWRAFSGHVEGKSVEDELVASKNASYLYVSRRSKVILISAIARNGGSINFG
jgi:hypothetical protein